MTDDHSQHDSESKKAILEDIEKYGCHLALLEADSYLPAFVYSIGLFKKFGHPEVICFGLRTDVMASILNIACDLIKSGKTLAPDQLYSEFLEGYQVQFIPVDKNYYSNYVGYGGWFYGNTFDFPLLQLVWPDKEKRFPWDQGFNSNWKFSQPLLDRSTDFKFYEERNLGVYTTSQVLDGEPILFVFHNQDGDWQFHSSLDPDINDGRLVCLEEITKLDPTINELYHLQFGWWGWRDCKEDEWQYKKRDDE
jgi:hypothetical protein